MVVNYPTDPPVIIKKNKNIDKDRTLLHEICFGTHSGTLWMPHLTYKDGKTIVILTLILSWAMLLE